MKECLIFIPAPPLRVSCYTEATKAMAPISLSFSSSLLPVPLPNNNNSKNTSNYITLRAQEPNFLIVRCAFAAPARKTTPSSSEARKRHWKQGEYPGIPETAKPGISRRPPIKNVKKKLDRKNEAKAWANTVTESLSERIQNKQWFQALEVCLSFIFHLASR